VIQQPVVREVIEALRHDGELTKLDVVGRWPSLAAHYEQLRAKVLEDSQALSGPKGTGGFRATKKVANEIVSAVLNAGSLTKRVVRGRWRLNERDYLVVRSEVLRHSRVSPGPGRGGGFQAATSLDPSTIDEEAQPDAEPAFPLQGWQKSAVDLLANNLQHRDLEGLLGELTSTVRVSRRIHSGEDRRGTKKELALALVLKYGRDLLRNANIRHSLASARDLQAPKRWQPGKAAALEFVNRLGLPLDFAGERTPERREDFEYFEPTYEAPKLEDFQQEVSAQLGKILHQAKGRAIATLPTGAGKTLVAVQTIKSWLTASFDASPAQGVLWLAHTEELCEQAYQCFAQVWNSSKNVCRLYLFRFWGDYTKDLEAHGEALAKVLELPCIFVSTPQRIVNLIERNSLAAKAMTEDLKTTLKLIVVDEAHRAAAPSYRKILARFAGSPSVKLIGLTATPFRTEYLGALCAESGTAELREIFGHIIEPVKTLGIDEGNEPLEVLQRRGILSRLRWEVIETGVPLSVPEWLGESPRSVEDIDRDLGRKADRPYRRMKVLEKILPTCCDSRNSVLYFGPAVHDAECMAYLLAECGVPAAVVSGETLNSTRRRIIEDFKSGAVRVLCNCEVLTTGFDAPRVTHIVVARPTVSLVLYQQMIGRRLRGEKFGGTPICTIFDCEDNYKGGLALGYRMFRVLWRTPHTHGARGISRSVDVAAPHA
jgi:superfamily II DNA or RNA helicase